MSANLPIQAFVQEIQTSLDIALQLSEDNLNPGYSGTFKDVRVEVYANCYINDSNINMEEYDYCCEFMPLNTGSIENSRLVAKFIFDEFKSRQIKTMLIFDLSEKIFEFIP